MDGCLAGKLPDGAVCKQPGHFHGEAVILFCPCCCSPVRGDSESTEWECGHCGQKWHMDVDTDRLADHSPS